MTPAAPPAARTSSALPGLVMAAVIVCWGLGPPVSKLISAPAVVSVFYRFWLSVPILFTLAYLAGQRTSWVSLRRAALAGAAFGINLVFVFLTLEHAAVAVLSVVVTLQPGIILIVAGTFLGERATGWHLGWTAVAVAGTAVVILGAGGDVDSDALGVVFAVASMLTFTVYFVITKRVRSAHDVGAIEWMASVTLFSALIVTPWALIASDSDDFGAIGGADWLWLAFIIVFTGIIGHVLMTWVHKFIDATRSSIYILAMNLVAVAAAWPIHDEPLTWVQIAGGAVVFGAVAAVVSRPPATASDPPLSAAGDRSASAAADGGSVSATAHGRALGGLHGLGGEAGGGEDPGHEVEGATDQPREAQRPLP
jgi:drug/metabolite transporter (DMT)-like permease